jgi:CRP-like cAMP-binding protein
MKEEILDYLGQFCDMDKKTRDWLHANAKRIECKKKTQLVQLDGLCDHVWFIEKGLIRCYETDPIEKETCNWLLEENDIATSVNSFFCGTPSKMVVEAVEDCVLWAVSRRQLFDGFGEHPPLPILTLMTVLRYYCRLEIWASALRKKRPEDIYDYLLQHHPKLIGRVSEKDMGSFLGVSEPTYLDIRLGRKGKKK